MRLTYIILALLVIAVGAFILLGKKQPATTPTPVPNINESKSDNSLFQNPKKSAHYETNTPAHGSTLAGVPINVVIDFNFDLAKPSSIKIEMGGKDFGIGETLIDKNEQVLGSANELSLRRVMDPNSPDGIYTVNYNACWPDGSCHDGYFQFAINRKLSQSFIDQTDKKEVTIRLSEVMFKPQNIKVSKGTKITWINDEVVEHYINTDSHPAHTYYLGQNSKALGKGDSYSTVFEEPGIYPYHCSAHADSMVGNILVE